MKKKLIAISTLVPPAHSGAGKRVVSQLEEMSRLGWACELWTTTKAKSTKHYKSHQFSLPIKKTKIRYFIFIVAVFFVAFKKLLLQKNVVVYAVSSRCKIGLAANIAAIILRVPFVVGSTLDGYDDPRTLFELPYGPFLKKILNKAYVWIAISPRLYQSFDSINGIKHTFLPNHVDTEIFSPLGKSSRKKMRKIFDFNENSVLMISVGGIVPRKGTLDIIKVFAASSPEKWNGLLVLVGPYDKDEEYCAYYRECINLINYYGLVDKVIFLGPRNDVSDLLRISDLYIQMSKSEGFPNTLVEAMASGLPVIVKRIDGITDYILRKLSFKCSALCEDVYDATEMLNAFIRDPNLMKTCGDEGRCIVKSDFDRKNIMCAYDKLLSSALKKIDAGDCQ